MSVFHFDTYTVRPVEERDRTYLTQLIEADEYHKDEMDARFFLELWPGEDAWALEDQTGNVLFYFKTQTAVRLSMQFAQAETVEAKTRNRLALMKGLAWIEAQFRANRFREILFHTDAPELTVMAKRRMGFRDVSGLAKWITPPEPPLEARTEPWEASPQVSQGEGG
jgi:hypothetical protein